MSVGVVHAGAKSPGKDKEVKLPASTTPFSVVYPLLLAEARSDQCDLGTAASGEGRVVEMTVCVQWLSNHGNRDGSTTGAPVSDSATLFLSFVWVTSANCA